MSPLKKNMFDAWKKFEKEWSQMVVNDGDLP